MSTIISPNMLMPIPVVSVEAGPDWATDNNNCLTIVDNHNHSPGSGVQITPDGLNINADFPMNGYNLTGARSLRLAIQTTPLALGTDLACLYASGVDLYFNDALGNQVRITQSGGVAGSPGSISGLTSPASASYVSGTQTFVWQSDANTPGNTDTGFLILRNNTANSKGLTLFPPTAMGSNYSIVLPPLPSQTNFMTLDSSGNITAPIHQDNVTLEVSSGILQVKALGIDTPQLNGGSVTTAKIVDQNVTQAKLAPRTFAAPATAGNVLNCLSSSTGQTNNSGTFSTVSNQSANLTTTGRPVFITLLPGNGTTVSRVGLKNNNAGAQAINGFLRFRRGTTVINLQQITAYIAPSGEFWIPASAFTMLDNPTANTWTYSVQFATSGGAGEVVQIDNISLTAYEI